MLECFFISKSWKTKNEKLCLTKNIHAKLQICTGKSSFKSQANSFRIPETNNNNDYYSLESSELSMTSIFM